MPYSIQKEEKDLIVEALIEKIQLQGNCLVKFTDGYKPGDKVIFHEQETTVNSVSGPDIYSVTVGGELYEDVKYNELKPIQKNQSSLILNEAIDELRNIGRSLGIRFAIQELEGNVRIIGELTTKEFIALEERFKTKGLVRISNNDFFGRPHIEFNHSNSNFTVFVPKPVA